MNLSVGIVGLPNVGKSTLFNALLKKQVAASANYPFTTIEPNVGVVEVPDERLERLADVIAAEPSTSLGISRPPIIPAVVQFVDIAGLVEGAYKGEGLGNQFLSHIREVDAIIFVLRGFKNEDIIRSGSIDPKEDLEVLRDELFLKDLETLESQKSKVKGQNDNIKFKSALEKASALVSQGKWLLGQLTEEELTTLKDLQLLALKRTIVVLNCDEEDLTKGINGGKDTEGSNDIGGAIRICAKMEEELASLTEDEQKEYLKEIGIDEPGLNRLIKKAYDVLGLMSFYTAGEKEVRAWTVKKGSTAPVAAGVIHTDFERGFIAADIVSFDEFFSAGGWKGARDKGLVKTMGKSEIMPKDSVVEFKFNV